nr:esterase [Rubrobacter sp.]
MNNQMQDHMAEATRLTREGRLNEATALIQRALGGIPAPAAAPYAPQGPGSANNPIEAEFRI